MLNIFTSNRQAEGQKIDLKPSISFQEIVNRPKIDGCAPERGIPRTWDKILDTLAALNTQGLLPDLSAVAGLRKQDDTTDPMSDGRDDGIAVVE
jgi:hypothetical protein